MEAHLPCYAIQPGTIQPVQEAPDNCRHKNSRKTLMTKAGMLFFCVALASASGAFGQTRDIGRPVGERPPFEAVAKALGMERGVRRELTSINAIFFTARGTIGERKVSNAIYSMS